MRQRHKLPFGYRFGKIKPYLCPTRFICSQMRIKPCCLTKITTNFNWLILFHFLIWTSGFHDHKRASSASGGGGGAITSMIAADFIITPPRLEFKYLLNLYV